MSMLSNPYQLHELKFPKIYQEKIQRYTQTKSEDGKKISPSQSPFPRMIDLWLLGLCYGVQNEIEENVDKIDSYKFIEGSILSSDPWRINFISLLIIGYTGRADIISNPKEVINLANTLVQVGLPEVFHLIEDGNSDPLLNISVHLLKALNNN